MHAPVLCAVISLGLAGAMSPLAGLAQSDRNFVFTDVDGHLIIRFAGSGKTGLSESQAYEILNQEFSRMIHDRLHADLRFQDEPRDPAWAQSMEPQLERYAGHLEPEFSDIYIECRAASCRIILEQSGHWNVPEHQTVLETVQQSLEDFVGERKEQFEPVFMITAYYKEYQTPHIKAFLPRTDAGQSHR